jgi:hypothetical protein
MSAAAPLIVSESPRKTFFVLAVAALSIVGGGCVKNREPADQRVLRSLESEGSGVVAVATALDEASQHITLCSGALVAPNLVLTARHCVSRAVTATPSCDAKGRSHNGVHLAEDADPQQITIFARGEVHPDSDIPSARAIRTLHPSGQVLCDADVAFLVLDRPVTGVRIMPMRLSGPVESGDIVVPVGFGGGAKMAVGTRVARPVSTVLATGPASNRDTGAVLGPREFEVDQATCRGDSGGPAVDARTGEIVGVVSRGGSCSAQGNHVYTRVDAYNRLAIMALSNAERAMHEDHVIAAIKPADNKTE